MEGQKESCQVCVTLELKIVGVWESTQRKHACPVLILPQTDASDHCCRKKTVLSGPLV